MGYKDFEVVQVRSGGVKTFAFEYEESLSSSGNGDWLLIPDDMSGISVTVQASGGATAKVQTTIDPLSVVKSGTGITAVDWDYGEVTTPTQDYAMPVTAIRLVQSGSGTTKMTVRCQ